MTQNIFYILSFDVKLRVFSTGRGSKEIIREDDDFDEDDANFPEVLSYLT